MKKQTWILSVTGSLLISGALGGLARQAFCAEPPPESDPKAKGACEKGGKPGERGGKPGEKGGRHGGKDGPRRMFHGLDLTEEQKTQVKTILDAARAAGEKDEPKEDRRKRMHEAFKKIVDTVLTAEQKKKFEERKKHGKPGHGPRPDFDLTEEQEAKKKVIIDEAKKKAEAAKDKTERRQIMQDAHKKIHDEVLTDEQRKKFKEHRKSRNPLAQVGASDEQLEKAEKIMTEARVKAEQSENQDEKKKVMAQAMKEVFTTVLTQEQQTQLAEKMAEKMTQGMAKKLTLDETQTAQVKKILLESQDQFLNSEDPGEVMKATFQKICDDVLTAEQKVEAEKMKERFGQRRGPGGPGGPGGREGRPKKGDRPKKGSKPELKEKE